jgi:DNA-directed RNA polymerase subunit RPC12/RpoP
MFFRLCWRAPCTVIRSSMINSFPGEVNIIFSPTCDADAIAVYLRREMRKCRQCNGQLKRVHRTFLEHFTYLAVYECEKCETEEFVPRRYTYHLGPAVRCPRCGSGRPSKLRERDQIDRMDHSLLNLLEWLARGKLYHCCFCRLQFYDRRPLAERPKSEAVKPPATAKSTI